MKKITFTFLFLFLIILQVPSVIQYNIGELEADFGKNCAYMDIKDTGTLKNTKEFSDAVSAFAQKENAFVATLSYRAQSEQSERTELFLAGQNIPSFLVSKGLSRQTLTRLYTAGTPLSGGAAGFHLFNPNRDCTLHGFTGLKDKSLARTYYVYPSNRGAAFQTYLEDQFDVTFFHSDELIYLESGRGEQLAGIALMAVALLVFWAFWVVSDYQRNAVKKLHGYSNLHCGVTLFGRFAGVALAALLSTILLGAAGCGVYNRWTNYLPLLWDCMKTCLPVLGGLLLLAAVFELVFFSSDVKYALKGKKPYGILTGCAVILKGITIVFLCFAVTSIGREIGNSRNILQEVSRLSQISTCRYMEFRLASGSGKYMSEMEKRGSAFYRSVDGILMNNRNIISARVNGAQGGVLDQTVFINNNYLTINPIYDSEGKRVTISENDIAKNEMVVLVPEQYRKQEAALYREFNEWYHMTRYVSAPLNERGESDRTTKLRLRFVKDNQSYYSYDTDVNELKYNEITDPFAMLVTKGNMDNSFYFNYVCNGDFYLFDNEKQSIDDILKAAQRTGISNDLVNVPTVESAVDTLIQDSRNSLVLSATILALSLFIVCLICVYTVKNYMEQNRKLLFVKKMLGYPFLKSYGGFLCSMSLLQLLLFLLIKAALRMKFSVWLPACIGFLLIDFAIMCIAAVLYRKSLTQQALKGDGA